MGTETWSPERRKAWLDECVRATKDDDDPDPEAWGGAEPGAVIGIREAPLQQGRAAIPPLEPPDPEVFDYTHLRSRKLRRLEKFPMPDGSHLWVAPFVGGRARDLVLASGDTSPELQIQQGDSRQKAFAKAQAAGIELQAAQMVMVCFKDEEGTAPCFGENHIPAILEELPHATIKAICGLSERMIAPPTKEDLAPFGQDAENCLRTWFSASEAWDACPDGLREMTEDLLSRVPAWS